MGISGALANAVSGLRAASRGAAVVSSNISNALTPGYGARELSLSSAVGGGAGGVMVNGVTRHANASLATDRRLADAAHMDFSARADFLARLSDVMGTPDDPASLTARLSEMESKLVMAASRPDANDRLTAVVIATQDVATAFAKTSEAIQDARTQADRTISIEVNRLNNDLVQVKSLNKMIAVSRARNQDTSSLLDQRQQVIDRIGTLVPTREVARDNGAVALYTTGGAVLLDGRAATVGFEPVNLVTAQMSMEAGNLSGLTIDGKPIRSEGDRGPLSGGSIGAQFAVRDSLGIEAQAELDAMARDLIERFQEMGADSTRGPGDPGLLTDRGAVFDVAKEVGIAGRLALNANVDPDAGGEAWRLRDGLNAVTRGDVGDATLLRAFGAALTGDRAPVTGARAGTALSALGLASSVVSDLNVRQADTERKLSFAAVSLTALTEQQLAEGVDSDSEIQRLMMIEQAYAANARVVETVDEMMQTILRI